MVNAHVFISCGQLTPEEKEIGTAVVDYFKKRGFEPYFAEEVHSPLGLTQNVYAILKNSEYFVCINPKREHSDVGSLFGCHTDCCVAMRRREKIHFLCT